MSGFFVFCLDFSIEGTNGDYIPATRTVLPTRKAAKAYADTIQESLCPVVIPRDELFAALQGERFDFNERWEIVDIKGTPTLTVKNQSISVFVSMPDGSFATMSWNEFRTSVQDRVNSRTLLEASREITQNGKATVETLDGTYKIEKSIR